MPNEEHHEIEREEGREQAPVGVNYTLVALVTALSALSLAAVFGLMWVLMVYLVGRDETLAPAGVVLEDLDQIPPQPRISPHQPAQLQLLREDEEQALTTWGWIDRDAGVARIPIDRAMDLLAERWESQQEPPARSEAEEPDDTQPEAAQPQDATGREDE